MSEKDRIDHLLRRTGFGVTAEERNRAHRLGYEATVEELIRRLGTYRLKEHPPDVPVPPVVVPVTLLTFGKGLIWWLQTMACSHSPLNERLTMFWHRHFATSGQKVFRPGWMFQQNLTFRREGTGPFADLLKAMVRDPALLNWLDADNNPASRPNENFARELLELFTLGRGNYSEKDVKELAKLTTGKRVSRFGTTYSEPPGAYDGPVAVLDRKGQMTLHDFAEHLAMHPTTARRLVRLLWEDFAACPLPQMRARRLEKLWSSTRGNVTVVLREILLCDEFHAAPRRRVNSPVEYWLTCARILKWNSFRLEDTGFLEQAGEQLFFPPSVKGWDLGEALIHPAALHTRLEIANRVVSRLKENHFAFRGLLETPDRARYLEFLSGGQIAASTLPPNLSDFTPREALLLGLASPDLWLS